MWGCEISNLLTKSKYMIGLYCPKHFWMIYNDPGKIPEHSKDTLHKFDQGNIVGEMAKKLFPDGVDIPTEDFMGNIRSTQTAIKHSQTLFEGGIMVGNLFSRADILKPVKDEWDIIEVKSSTKVKEENIFDVAFQKHCLIESGLKIRKCFLMHINNQYVREGDLDPKELFTKTDITEQVDEVLSEVPKNIGKLLNILTGKCPEEKKGFCCDGPYPCPVSEFHKLLPEHHIFQLIRGGKKIKELFESGVVAFDDIPKDYELKEKHKIQVECAKTGKPHIDKEGIKKFMDKLKNPLSYLDFETFRTAIPPYDGTKPYQQIPFQYSMHIDKEHKEFLADGSKDPREEFLVSLKKDLGDKGSIVAYNKSFEIRILKETVKGFPEYNEWVKKVIDRFVDLYDVFREFHYYSPLQKGSTSIKYVLPALTGKSYDDLEIGGGDDASLAYLDIMTGKLNKDEVDKIRMNLKKYCELDTEGMVLVMGELNKLNLING